MADTFSLKHLYDRAGRTETFGSYKAAVEAARQIWKHAEIGHTGDISDGGERTLVWASKEDAESEDGSRAVAAIKRLHD